MMDDFLTTGLGTGDALALLTQGLLVGTVLITLRPKPIALITVDHKPIAFITL